MSGSEAQACPESARLEGVESTIYQSLENSSEELAHAECFDEEQRAEIYAILQAIKTDTEKHRETIKLLADKLTKDRRHA